MRENDREVYNFKNPLRIDNGQVAFTIANIESYCSNIMIGDMIDFFADAVNGEGQISYSLNKTYQTRLKKEGIVTAIYPHLVEVSFMNEESRTWRKHCFKKKQLFLNELKGCGNIRDARLRYEEGMENLSNDITGSNRNRNN